MRIVHAMGGAKSVTFPNFEIIVKSALVSFEYLDLLEIVDRDLKDVDYLMLDSGAFSAWNKGAEIDIAKYAEWISEAKEKRKHIKRIVAVNLDVITDRNDSKEKLHQAWDTSMKNLEFLQSKGHEVLPVHHQFEPYSILEDYAKDFPFICISPNNAEHTKSKRVYLDRVFSIIKSSVATHGLAVTSEQLVLRYPWFSVDSSIAQVPFRYGHIGISKKRTRTSEVDNASRNSKYTIRLAYETIKHLKKIEEQATALWKRRGVEWEI